MAARKKPVDAVIIGYGWTGAIMAKTLTDAGLSVVALERGPARDTAPDFEYRKYGSFVLGTGVGGAGVHWNGMLWRASPEDLRLRSHIEQRYGEKFVPADMTIQDYPVMFEELEPHFDHFEKVCGATGTAGKRIAQMHERKVQIQQCRQQIGQIGGDGPRFSSHPHRRNCRECDQIPKDVLIRKSIRIRVYWHVSARRPQRPHPVLLVGPAEERTNVSVPPKSVLESSSCSSFALKLAHHPALHARPLGDSAPLELQAHLSCDGISRWRNVIRERGHLMVLIGKQFANEAR
jgi:hypothetical protein